MDAHCIQMKFAAEEAVETHQPGFARYLSGDFQQRHSFFRSRQIQRASNDVWA
jgi:hypothetical protein